MRTAVSVNIPITFILLIAGKPSTASEEFEKDPRLTRTLKSDDNSNAPTLDEELKSTEIKW